MVNGTVEVRQSVAAAVHLLLLIADNQLIGFRDFFGPLCDSLRKISNDGKEQKVTVCGHFWTVIYLFSVLCVIDLQTHNLASVYMLRQQHARDLKGTGRITSRVIPNLKSLIRNPNGHEIGRSGTPQGIPDQSS